MKELFTLFQPGFLLHNALWGSIAVGFFCPLIGVYFMLRRMVLLGVALPQISAAGISFIFFLQGLGISWSLHAGEANDRFLALAGSTVFTIAAIFILRAAWPERETFPATTSADDSIASAWRPVYLMTLLAIAACLLVVRSPSAADVHVYNANLLTHAASRLNSEPLARAALEEEQSAKATAGR